MSIKLLSAALDVSTVAGEQRLVVRGVIDPASLKEIKADIYQREILPGAKSSALMKALKESTVPDVELGMRGSKTREHEGGVIFLQDDVFVIDGLQRISAAKRLVSLDPSAEPRIGAVVHMDTTPEWETTRFRILNQERTQVSAAVLLRNSREDHPGIEMAFKLCSDQLFVMHNRVSWNQRMARGEILQARLFCQTATMLHSRFGPGRGNSVADIAVGLDKITEVVGRNTVRDNIKEFYDLIDRCFNIRHIQISTGATQIKGTFLLVFARLLADHDDFWKGNRLVVSKDLERKIAAFPLNDPEVIRLAGAGGQAYQILYGLMVNHINSGKRTRRLQTSLKSKKASPPTQAEVVEA